MFRTYSSILPIAMDAKENIPPSERSTYYLPSLDEWGKHGLEEDIFLYLLNRQEDNMFKIALRPPTGTNTTLRGRDLRGIPSRSSDARIEP